MNASENQIVVYQPNETVRLDVRLENETVWLTQSQMATLFGCSTDNVGLHLKNVYSCGELDKDATTEESSEVRKLVVGAWTRKEIFQAPLGQLPWYHHLALLECLKSCVNLSPWTAADRAIAGTVAQGFNDTKPERKG